MIENTSELPKAIKVQLTKEQTKDIAENLEAGIKCFYHIKTGKLKTVIDFDHHLYAEDELWEKDIEEIEKNWSDYFEFEKLESHDSFRIMADFSESVDNPELQQKLIEALNKPNPLRNFKWQINNSGIYRKKWFDFKHSQYLEWVEKQIEHLERRDEL